VLPPIARLTPDQAVEQFLLGYTAKVAGTERGVKEPEATFSACFGAPFLPRAPKEYAKLLRDKIEKHGTRCYLLNTGWTGGGYGTGKRMPLPQTRAMLAAVLSGEVDKAQMRVDTNFGFEVPVALDGVDSKLLDPQQAWNDVSGYDEAAAELVAKFKKAKAK
jgi:phosphoenolpyruvate carboxykinase (ATP)